MTSARAIVWCGTSEIYVVCDCLPKTLSCCGGRVSCQRTGAMTFKVGGNPLYFEVNIRNVAGAGAIGKNWGMSAKLIGKAISFKIFTPVTNKYAIAWKVVPTSWQPGGLYSGGQFQ
eukprot:jgi/Mesen1/6831/ME000350S05938